MKSNKRCDVVNNQSIPVTGLDIDFMNTTLRGESAPASQALRVLLERADTAAVITLAR